MSMEHRKLHFDTLADAMAEAERLAATEVTTSGSYSLGQIAEHLAITLNVAGGFIEPPKMPWFVKLLGRAIKNMVINKPSKPGFKLPSKAQSFFWPGKELTTEQGMAKLRDAYSKFVSLENYPVHPLFGRMTKEQSHQLQCRHFELHLGFVHPQV